MTNSTYPSRAVRRWARNAGLGALALLLAALAMPGEVRAASTDYADITSDIDGAFGSWRYWLETVAGINVGTGDAGGIFLVAPDVAGRDHSINGTIYTLLIDRAELRATADRPVTLVGDGTGGILSLSRKTHYKPLSEDVRPAQSANNTADGIGALIPGDRTQSNSLTLSFISMRGGRSVRNGGAIDASGTFFPGLDQEYGIMDDTNPIGQYGFGMDIILNEKITMEDNQAQNVGGAIFTSRHFNVDPDTWVWGDVQITNNFVAKDNIAKGGGAIFTTTGDIYIGDSAVLQGNQATGIYTVDGYNMWYEGNGDFNPSSTRLMGGGMGGALFTGVEWRLTPNGYVRHDRNADVHIGDGLQMLDNTANYSGGGIFVEYGAVGIEDNAVITGNVAVRGTGGAIAVYQGMGRGVPAEGEEPAGYMASIRIGDNATISNNTAYLSGGAISSGEMTYVYGDLGSSNIEIGENLTLTNNRAGYYDGVDGLDTGNGGAIYVFGGVLIGAGANISFNHAGMNNGSGGAIMAYNNLTIDGMAVIEGNTALSSVGTGGALYSDHTVNIRAFDDSVDGFEAPADKVRFHANQAYARGGAIFAGENAVIGSYVEFTENVVTNGDGGALFIDQGEVSANSLRVANHVTFEGNRAGNYGGAVYSMGNAPITIGDNVAFIGNVAEGNHNFTGNNARQEFGGGGALYSGYDVTIGGEATFSGNTAIIGAGAPARANELIHGGAIYNERNLTFTAAGAYDDSGFIPVRTGTAFVDNQTTGYGGAIYMHGDPNIQRALSLDAGTGFVLFRGNRQGVAAPGAAGAANSVYLNRGITLALNVEDNGRIIFDDAIGAGANQSGPSTVGNNLTLTGGAFDFTRENDTYGLVQFSGHNQLSNAADVDGGVNIYGGMFRVTGGSSFATLGQNSVFTVHAAGAPGLDGNAATGGTLAGGGTITAGQGFIIRGTVAPDNLAERLNYNEADQQTRPNGSITSTGAGLGTLTLDGDALFDGATFDMELLLTQDTAYANGITMQSDRVAVTGALSFSGVNVINIQGALLDDYAEYVLVTGGAASNLTAADLQYFGRIFQYGNELGARNRPDLKIENNSVILTTASTENNLYMLWNLPNDGTWDLTTENWVDRPDSGVRQFANGDYVVFNQLRVAGPEIPDPASPDPENPNMIPGPAVDADPIAITIAGDAVEVSGMEINGGDYTFAGGDLLGSMNYAGKLVTPTGKLAVNAGKATFANTVDFVNGIDIENDAEVVLAEGGDFAQTAINLKGYESSLTYNMDSIHQMGNVITGPGMVNKEGEGILILNNQSTATGLFRHNAGIVYMGNGSVWGGNFTMSPAGEAILLAGDGARIAGDADFYNEVDVTGTLTVGGTVDLADTALTLDLSAGGNITAGGNIRTDGVESTKFILAGWQNGTYTLLTSTGGLVDNLLANSYFYDTSGNLIDNTGRRQIISKSLTSDRSALVIETDSNSTSLNWTGAASGEWNESDNNWNGGDSQFINGDAVSFGAAAGNRDITVQAAGVVVADMIVTGNSSYTFRGDGVITGDRDVNTSGSLYDASTSGLVKNGTGTVTFANASNSAYGVDFKGLVKIEAGGVRLMTNLRAGQFDLGANGTLTFSGLLDGAGGGNLNTSTVTADTANIAGTLKPEITNINDYLTLVTTGEVSATVISADTLLDFSSTGAQASGDLSGYSYKFTKEGNTVKLTLTTSGGGDGPGPGPGGPTGPYEGSKSINTINLEGAMDAYEQTQNPDMSGSLGDLYLAAANAGAAQGAQILTQANGAVLTANAALTSEMAVRSISRWVRQHGTNSIQFDDMGIEENGAIGTEKALASYNPEYFNPWRFFAQANGGMATQDMTDGDPGFEAKNYGGGLAIDRVIGNRLRVGAAFNYAKTNLDWDGGAEGEGETFAGTGYGRYEGDTWFVNAHVSYGKTDNTSERRVFVPNRIDERLRAEFDTDWLNASLMVGSEYAFDKWTLTPAAGFEYMSISIPDIRETTTAANGKGLNQSISGDDYDSLQAQVSLAIERTFMLGDLRSLTPKFNVGMAYDFKDREQGFATSLASYSNFPVFTSYTPSRGNVTFNVGGGFDMRVSENIYLFVQYEGDFQTNYSNHTFSGGMKALF